MKDEIKQFNMGEVMTFISVTGNCGEHRHQLR